MSENNKVLKFNVEERVEKDLPFEPNPDTNNLVICGIDSVTKLMVEVPTETKDGTPSTNEYAGKKVPKLEIIFKTYPSVKTNQRQRVLKVVEDIPYTTKNDGTALDMDKVIKSVTDKYMRLKHIFDCYSGTPNFKPISKLPDLDMEAGIDKRLSTFDKFFTAFEEAFNKGKDGTPIYRPAKGNPYPVWLKVLPDFNSKAWYTIPSFVDTGFIELVKIDSITKVPYAPNIRIKANESLVLTPKKKGEVRGGDAPDTESSTDDVNDLLARARGEM